MTSALAAAMRELDRSKASLEQELLQNVDFATLRRLDQAGAALDPELARHRRLVVQRLEGLPVYQALLAVMSARHYVAGGAASDLQAGDTSARPATFARPARLDDTIPRQRLTAVRGLKAEHARQLEELGIVNYAQIAAWTAADVRIVAAALGLGREISRRNWIEQAALLAMRAAKAAETAALPATNDISLAAVGQVRSPEPAAETVEGGASVALSHETLPEPAPHVVDAPSLPAHQAVGYADMLRIAATAAAAAVAGSNRLTRDALAAEPPQAAVSEPKQEAISVSQDAPERLDLIRGLDAANRAKLIALGVDRYAAIAGWRAADLQRVAAVLAVPARLISREGWIEQAAVLAAGRGTEYSRRVLGGELAAVCPLPAPSAWPASAPHLGRMEPARSEMSETNAPSDDPVAPLQSERSLARRLDVEVPAPTTEEASVTIVVSRPAAPGDHRHHAGQGEDERDHAAAGASRTTQPAHSVQHADTATWREAQDRSRTYAATGDEATVEIIRPQERPGLDNLPPAGDVHRWRPSAGLPAVPRSTEWQPSWVSSREGDAGGVVRRFLRALKRNA